MTDHTCHCLEKAALCETEWTNEIGHAYQHNVASQQNAGDCEFHCKIPPHPQNACQIHFGDENTNATERRHSSRKGDLKMDNNEEAKNIPCDRPVTSAPTTPTWYSVKESDIHKAYAQKFAKNNPKCDSNDLSTVSRNSCKCNHSESHNYCKQQPQRIQQSSMNSSVNPTTNLPDTPLTNPPTIPPYNLPPNPITYPPTNLTTYLPNCGCSCQRAMPVRLSSPVIPAVNVVRSPCLNCGSQVFKCMGCGYNMYGHAFPPVYPPVTDSALQFNGCSSGRSSILDEACEKRLDACIKDVSKNLKWVLNTLQRLKFCPACGYPHYTA